MIDFLSGLPATASPQAWTKAADAGSLTGISPPGGNLFVNPITALRADDAPALLFATSSADFTLQAEVEVAFAATFDAGVLLLWQDADYWAKLCFELSPEGEPMVVSVVNRETSDDCNSVVLPRGSRVHLRCARKGPGCLFHYSLDGKFWHLVRAFRLLTDKPMSTGFLVQSPTGEGCRAEFRQIQYQGGRTITDIRSGE